MDWYPLWNSLRIAAISTGIIFFAGIFAAYYIAKLPRLIKGVLDLFTAMLISASIGSVVGVLAVPQCAIQFALLFGATMLMPYTTPTMFADFSACGGIIMLGAGLRQMGLVQVPILSMLPGLFFVMPLSALWKQIM